MTAIGDILISASLAVLTVATVIGFSFSVAVAGGDVPGIAPADLRVGWIVTGCAWAAWLKLS